VVNLSFIHIPGATGFFSLDYTLTAWLIVINFFIINSLIRFFGSHQTKAAKECCGQMTYTVLIFVLIEPVIDDVLLLNVVLIIFYIMVNAYFWFHTKIHAYIIASLVLITVEAIAFRSSLPENHVYLLSFFLGVLTLIWFIPRRRHKTEGDLQ